MNRQQLEESGFILVQDLAPTNSTSTRQRDRRRTTTGHHRPNGNRLSSGRRNPSSKPRSTTSGGSYADDGRRVRMDDITFRLGEGRTPFPSSVVNVGPTSSPRSADVDAARPHWQELTGSQDANALYEKRSIAPVGVHLSVEGESVMNGTDRLQRGVDDPDVHFEFDRYSYRSQDGDVLRSSMPPSRGDSMSVSNGISNIAYSLSAHDFEKKLDYSDKKGDQDHEKIERENLPTGSGCCYWYAKFLARFPVLFCLAILLLTAASGAVSFTLYDLPLFDDPQKGFEARHTPIRDRLTGLELFYQHTDDVDFHIMSQLSNISKRSTISDGNGNSTGASPTPIDGAHQTAIPSSTQASYSAEDDDSETIFRLPCVLSGSFHRNLRIVFSSMNSRTSLFTVEAFHSMCHLYDEYVIDQNDLRLSTYVRGCQPVSLGQYAALLQNKTSCYQADEADVFELKHLLRECAPHYANKTLIQDCTDTSCPTVPSQCTTLNAAYYIFHYLLPSGVARHIAEGDFDVPFTLMISPISEYSAVASQLYTDRLQGRDELHDDVTQISAVGGQFKFDLFSRFLLSDIKYTGVGVGLILFIIWLYTGSLFITVMTIMDMAMSLVLAYSLYVVVFGLPFFPFVNILAVILVLGIGADDAFVYMDIWRKMKEKYGRSDEDRVVILQETLHHASITMFVTSFTTSSALFFSVTSTITAIKCFAVYSGCAILFNFVFTVTWLPAIVIIEERYLRSKKSQEQNTLHCSVLKKVSKMFATAMRYAFEEVIPRIVFKLRYVWLVIFTLLGVGGACAIFIYPKLQLPTQSVFQIFVISDYLEQYDQVYRKNFDFEKVGQNMPIKFVWGLVAKDNGNSWDPDDKGSLVLDEGFNLSAPEAQEWLLRFCSDLKNQTFYSTPAASPDFCFIDIFKELIMEGPCDSPLFGINISPCCNNSNFPYHSELFEQCAAMFISLAGLEHLTRFGEDQHMKGIMLSFTSTTQYSLNYESINSFWTTVDKWSEKEMNNAPLSISGGWFVSFDQNQLYFFDLQQSLVTGFPFSIGLSLGVAALVLLLTTWNVLITLYAILSISGTVFVTIGALVLNGWEMNILESTIMSLAVGLSVDFTIHYGVAYRIAPNGDRASRSDYSMRQLTAAISTAALSTLVAGACMLPATVVSYHQIGVFLTLVMTVSWAYGTFFFMSLCRTIGPEKNCSQIQPPSNCCCCRDR